MRGSSTELVRSPLLSRADGEDASLALATLTSLAMLKVRIDQQEGDYIEYLVPFAKHILSNSPPDIVTDDAVATAIRNSFGLRIPTRGIHLVLQRLVKRGVLTKSHGRYTLSAAILPTDLQTRRQAVSRDIDDVVRALREFAVSHFSIEWSEKEATNAILGFLSRFAIDCLQAYTFGTALPDVEKSARRETFVVGAFVKSSHQSDAGKFEKIIVLVKGQMLANALICPDLESIEKKFGKVTFYFDTPIILDLLGLQSSAERDAKLELIRLLRRLHGTLAVFSHTLDELTSVIQWAEGAIDKPQARSRILEEMHRQGKTRSDLILVREKLPELLRELGMTIHRTPEYKCEFQISEKDLTDALHDEIRYLNTRAVSYDVNSVRSIYAFRGGRCPRRLEDAGVVFVTSNAAFARAAFDYGKEHESTREVSAVITDYALSNIAWLKAPLGAPELPVKEILANCYAAMSPGNELWTKFLSEIQKLRTQGRISADDHQILRSATQSREELMALTLGEDELLKPTTITEILDRVRADLTRSKDVEISEIRHGKTLVEQRAEQLESDRLFVETRLFWIVETIGRRCADAIVVMIAAVLAIGCVLSPLATTSFMQESYVLTAVFNSFLVAIGLIAVGFWLRDLTALRIHKAVSRWVRAFLMRRLRTLFPSASGAVPRVHETNF